MFMTLISFRLVWPSILSLVLPSDQLLLALLVFNFTISSMEIVSGLNMAIKQAHSLQVCQFKAKTYFSTFLNTVYFVAQLYELRKTTLAKIICANSDDIEYVQKNVFRGESER